MAVSKISKKENKDEIVIEANDKKEEIKVIDDLVDKKKSEVVIEKQEVVKIPEKRVKIMLNKDHRCNVGGEWYFLEKGKQYNVPEHVKKILNEANLLAPM